MFKNCQGHLIFFIQMWFAKNNLLPRKVIKISFVFRKKGEKENILLRLVGNPAT